MVLMSFDGVAHARFDAGVVAVRQQLLGDEVAADAAGDDAGADTTCAATLRWARRRRWA